MVESASNLLLNKQHSHASTLKLWPDANLTLGRVHEACGPNRRSLAMMIAQKMEGPIFWIAPEWNTDHPHADGVISFINPGRMTFIPEACRRHSLDCRGGAAQRRRAPCGGGSLRPSSAHPSTTLALSSRDRARRGHVASPWPIANSRRWRRTGSGESLASSCTPSRD